MGYVKLVGNRNPQNWTTELVYERDDETGEVTGSVKAGVPVDLKDSVKKQFEDRGYVFEKSSKEEAEEVAENVAVGSDTAGTGPVFGNDNPADDSGNK